MQGTVNPTISVKAGNCFVGILHVFYKQYNSNEKFGKILAWKQRSSPYWA